MSISVVPLEIVGHILGHLDTTHDLYCAITSSSIFSKAFYASRVHVITSIIQQIIPPGAQEHALAIIYAPRITQVDNLGELWAFLDNYFGTLAHKIFPWPHDIQTLTNLAQLASQVSRFEREYFEEKNAYLIGSSDRDISEQKNPATMPLGEDEHTRIQRAFFRVELYCRCFVIAEGEPFLGLLKPPGPAGSRDQFHHFLRRMKPWEIEEMSCIFTYLTSRVGSIINQMEDEIFAIISKHQVKTSNQSSEKFQNLREYIAWSFSDLFDIDGRHNIYEPIFFFVSNGLDFLEQVFHGESQEQRDLLLSTYTGRRASLPEAIWYGMGKHRSASIVEEVTEQVDTTIASSGGGEGDYLHASYGYREFAFHKGYQPIPSGSGMEPPRAWGHGQYEALRRSGYVFWDKARIDKADKALFSGFSSDCDFERQQEFDLTCRESAEQVLRFAMVPRKIMEEVKQKYGLKIFPSSEESDSDTEVGTYRP